ncbi:MAG TPA: adenylosuccinate lyase [Chitinophagales bacterium]|nr:adenylosuccinate lyase [Chitinophagales bacterium]
MNLDPLTAISPIDGRYRKKTESLSEFFSEYALFKYRVLVEVKYFMALKKLPLKPLNDFPEKKLSWLEKMAADFSTDDARRIKELEKVTNHDVKAVEYFLKEKFRSNGLGTFSEFIHFGLTSQDINNTAIPLLFKNALHETYFPASKKIISRLKVLAEEWRDIALLARTHGQPASPTRLGKEIMVFAERLETQLAQLENIPHSAKFGGATGNFNAHYAAFPDIDWLKFADRFVNQTLGLQRSRFTTQIEHYDNLAAQLDAMKRINTILIDFCRDMWTYISLDYFKQKVVKSEVGSSAMPHKVNPIDFENAEGNLGIANANFMHLSAKLPVSRLQRDLTDSTVLRTLGVPFAHTLVAFHSLLKGLDKVLVNVPAIRGDLEKNWLVVAEGIQTILRREGYPQPYELLKDLTRANASIDRKAIHAFIDRLKVPDRVKKELKQLTPFNYVGKNPKMN